MFTFKITITWKHLSGHTHIIMWRMRGMMRIHIPSYLITIMSIGDEHQWVLKQGDGVTLIFWDFTFLPTADAKPCSLYQCHTANQVCHNISTYHVMSWNFMTRSCLLLNACAYISTGMKQVLNNEWCSNIPLTGSMLHLELQPSPHWLQDLKMAEVRALII